MISLTSVLLTMVVSVSPEGSAKLPSQPAPEFGVASIGTNDELEVRTNHTQQIWETRSRVLNVDGKQQVKAYQICTLVAEKRLVKRAADQYWVYRDGATLDDDARRELLSKPRAVIVMQSRPPLDPFYQSFLKEGTVVVVLKPQLVEGPRPYVPPAAPAPPSATPPPRAPLTAPAPAPRAPLAPQSTQ